MESNGQPQVKDDWETYFQKAYLNAFTSYWGASEVQATESGWEVSDQHEVQCENSELPQQCGGNEPTAIETETADKVCADAGAARETKSRAKKKRKSAQDDPEL